MILALTAVRDEYIEHCLRHIDRYDNGRWDIHVLTDQPERFPKYKTHLYDAKVFAVYEKTLFALRLSERYKEHVMLIDPDDLFKPTDLFVNEFTGGGDKVLYYGRFPNAENYDYGQLLSDKIHFPFAYPRMKYMIEYWNDKGYDYRQLIPMWEWMLYFPYLGDKLKDVIRDIELYKPMVETGTILGKCMHRGANETFNPTIGCAEGIIFSYVFNKYNVEYETFNPIYID